VSAGDRIEWRSVWRPSVVGAVPRGQWCLCLPPSVALMCLLSRQRASIILLAALCSLAASDPAAAQTSKRGSLFIVGGGERPATLMSEYITLAGGKGHARIAVIPMASGDSTTGPELVAEFQQLGAEAWNVKLTHDQAVAPGAAATLDSATGIWFAGGDQVRLMNAIGGTPVETTMHRRYEHDGVVIGGTSAGAAVMSDVMITGEERAVNGVVADTNNPFRVIVRGEVETVRGFGFLSGAIVDQHFLKRKRNNRLLAVVLEHPDHVGVGIDESTVLIVNPDGTWRVQGASEVLIYDARHAKVLRTGPLGGAGLTANILPAGSRYDVRTGRALLPGS
jgi:cyanophycinase